jgi:HK97 family phage portal protein
MSIFSRLNDSWHALWGDSQGFVPVSGTVSTPVALSGSDGAWMGIAAYFACIRNLSEDVAKLPLITYRRLARGKERATNHPYYKLLRRRPYPSVGSIAFRETMMRNVLGWGNGYAEILRRNTGEAYALQIISPQNVIIRADKSGTGIEYVVKTSVLPEKTISPENMIHIHGLSANGIDGISIAGYARETLQFAASAQTYGKNIFARGGRPSGILTHEGKLQPEAKQALAKAWEEAYGGSNSGRTAVLDHGIKYEAISINPVDAQYLETRQFTVEEIARWFRMPLHKIQYLVRAQGWSTLDAQNTDYLTDTLMPWLIRWEEELTAKLFPVEPEYFVEHLVTGLLRGDASTRKDFYVGMFSIGGLSINEIRELENMNPIEGEGGDKHFVPLNMTPAEFANSINGGGGKAKENAQS